MLEFFSYYQGIELFVICTSFLIAVIFALSIHEFAHSFVANIQGDPTSKMVGRMTLNPLKHIDPIGFLCLMLFGFGWAKPVPINSLRFKDYRKGIFLTSIAGICANIFFSFISCGLLVVIFRFNGVTMLTYGSQLMNMLFYILYFSITINLGLALFNILPIPPLDGFNCLSSLCKGNSFLDFMKKYGYFILLIVILFGFLNILFTNVYSFVIPAFTNFWQYIFF